MDDSECVRDEMAPCHLLQVSMQNVKSIEQYKELALQNGEHLCLQLNGMYDEIHKEAYLHYV